MKQLLQQLLREEGHNSRFVYLINGVATVLCVISLMIATIYLAIRGRPGDEKFMDGLMWFAGIVLTGGVGFSAGGRWLTTKKVGGPGVQQQPELESTEKTTTIEKTVSAKGKTK